MADIPRRGRNRPDSRQMWDESERRNNRHGPGARDRRDDRDAYREDSIREIDRRHRSRSRSPRRDRRDRHRSRSRDRKDRDRDRERERDRDPDRQQRSRGDDRYRERGRGGRRDDAARGDAKPRPRDLEDVKPNGPPVRGGFPEKNHQAGRAGHAADFVFKDSERGRGPKRSLSPALGLPTRPKDDRPRSRGAGTPLTFKVGRHEDSDPRRRDDRSRSYDATDSPKPEGRNRAASQDHAMDVDDDGDREDDDVEVVDDGMAAMQAMMGFGGFGTTKGTHIVGNNAGAVRKEKKTEYRQYMNRVGGFNRPLSPGR
ncbi:hypothetical protein SLS62_007455 [Diatrype stigma]|uniref:U4/U6.U5 small nuclear ribonucleoprotein 27kDa protein domain-containing protein n=1 Tax=Diatrype stigma TaxID=117547 RepID=A0AAN9UZA1_9PEZI